MATLIVALDVPDGDKALHLARQLDGLVDWYKVGLEMFISQGPEIVRKLKAMDYRVFLDLKLYDIPNTVANAVAQAIDLGVDMLTIHCQGGKRMCDAARKVVRDRASPCLLFGVTVLTSFAPGEMPGIDMPPREYAALLAREAWKCGLAGVVCSGLEAGAIKEADPEILCLCPGIRLVKGEDDQRRVVTPAEAVASGADYLVVGRAICQAQDPVKAASEILKNMARE